MGTAQLILSTRPANESDTAFIESLLPRLTEFGVPSWRNPEQMFEVDKAVLTQRIRTSSDDHRVVVAENSTGTRLGFVHFHQGSDHYFSEPHGHISDLIVAPEGQGKGVASLLIRSAEDWCRTQGFGMLTLSVFAKNVHAREVYRHLGFGEDILKYVKVVGAKTVGG